MLRTKENNIIKFSGLNCEELVIRAIKNAHPDKCDKNIPRCVCVRNVFAVGSTTGSLLCKEVGLDPDELLNG